MDHLVFLYNIICYSIGTISIFFALLAFVLWKRPEDLSFILLMSSFLIILVPQTIGIYVLTTGNPPGLVTAGILDFLTLAGSALMIYALPRFINTVFSVKSRRLINLLFLMTALAVFILAGATAASPFSWATRAVVFGAVVAAILYAILMGNLVRFFKEKLSAGNVETRWMRIMSIVTVLTLILIPFSVMIDMFPSLVPELVQALPHQFQVFPLFYLLWNLVYVIFTVPLYRQKTAIGPLRRQQNLSNLGLSRREQEIALLIVSGLSYKEIAGKLCISLATVKTHIMRIYGKTACNNKIDLANLIHQPEES